MICGADGIIGYPADLLEAEMLEDLLAHASSLCTCRLCLVPTERVSTKNYQAREISQQLGSWKRDRAKDEEQKKAYQHGPAHTKSLRLQGLDQRPGAPLSTKAREDEDIVHDGAERARLGLRDAQEGGTDELVSPCTSSGLRFIQEEDDDEVGVGDLGLPPGQKLVVVEGREKDIYQVIMCDAGTVEGGKVRGKVSVSRCVEDVC